MLHSGLLTPPDGGMNRQSIQHWLNQVLLAASGAVKLVDFGLARLVQEAGKSHITASGKLDRAPVCALGGREVHRAGETMLTSEPARGRGSNQIGAAARNGIKQHGHVAVQADALLPCCCTAAVPGCGLGVHPGDGPGVAARGSVGVSIRCLHARLVNLRNACSEAERPCYVSEAGRRIESQVSTALPTTSLQRPCWAGG